MGHWPGRLEGRSPSANHPDCLSLPPPRLVFVVPTSTCRRTLPATTHKYGVCFIDKLLCIDSNYSNVILTNGIMPLSRRENSLILPSKHPNWPSRKPPLHPTLRRIRTPSLAFPIMLVVIDYDLEAWLLRPNLPSSGLSQRRSCFVANNLHER